jgi:hypothetical protein
MSNRSATQGFVFRVLNLAGRGEWRDESLEWRIEPVSCPVPTVQIVGNGIEFVLTVGREVGAFGPILAKQSIYVLAGPALSWAVWITEVDVHAGGGGKSAFNDA